MPVIIMAAVLGVVAGTCTGYLVQADREPTALPPLSQPVLAQGDGPGPEPLSAAQDPKLKTDGDLRKLLLKKPRGAKDVDWVDADGWQDLTGYAATFGKPRYAFPELIGKEFRRSAVTGWRVGSTQTVEIRLIQFRQVETMAADEASAEAQLWVERDHDVESWSIPGTGEGMAYVHAPSEDLPYHRAEAHAWRGDIALEVWVDDTKPISKKTILDLAERQMERL
ncbi:hypothetical protein [Streptomyces sp. NPDC002328]|uniref:hypothetical protein n=1 Tax=Streptomyces sp. NPDC002328 TaxID=3364642 RepID=UPI0036C679FA